MNSHFNSVKFLACLYCFPVGILHVRKVGLLNFLVLFVALVFSDTSSVLAQTDIHIAGAQAGFPVAVPQMCDQGGAASESLEIPKVISGNLQISGLFKVLNPATFIETPGKCLINGEFAYSDWTVIGSEGLVRGNIRSEGDKVTAELFLFDVLQQKAVLGKRYTASRKDARKIAHKFSNEILFYFTGEKGVFGTSIAFVSQSQRFKELFVMDIDGSNVRQLTQDRGLVFSPSWSPNGEKIVYTSYVSRTPELYITTPDGRRPERITRRPGLEVGAQFSPGGNTLISAASFNGITKLVLFDLKGKLLSRLTHSGSIEVSPEYSPNGSEVVFCSNRAGGPQIYIMGAGGDSVRRISYADSNYCTSPAWSPKGDKIAFVCRNAGFQLYLGDPSGGVPVQLTFSGDNEDPSWSPDGRFLAFSSTGLGGGKGIAILSLLGGRPTKISGTLGDSSQPAWGPMPLD